MEQGGLQGIKQIKSSGFAGESRGYASCLERKLTGPGNVWIWQVVIGASQLLADKV